MFLSIIHDAENDFKIMVRKITVRILPTRPHLRSANFGPRFTRWRSAGPHVRTSTGPHFTRGLII